MVRLKTYENYNSRKFIIGDFYRNTDYADFIILSECVDIMEDKSPPTIKLKMILAKQISCDKEWKPIHPDYLEENGPYIFKRADNTSVSPVTDEEKKVVTFYLETTKFGI